MTNSGYSCGAVSASCASWAATACSSIMRAFSSCQFFCTSI
jgi:hypothetical protein